MVADVFREQLRLSSERRRRLRYEEAFREGYEEGRRRERARWQAWLARMEAAERQNRPFDEPPPGGELLAHRRVVSRQRSGVEPGPLACL